MTLIAGRIFTFWTMIGLFLIIDWSLHRAKVRTPWIRRIPGLEAVEEAVGRATEMGRPVFYSPGGGDVTDADAIQSMAGIEVLAHVAHLTSKYNTSLICGVRQANLYAVADETVRQVYTEEGKLDAYKPEMVRFLSPEQFAYAAGCIGIMHREKAGAAILIGFFQAEALMLAEAATQGGAITIGGTTRMYQLPFFVAACDYCLIGEEIFTAGAYLSKDPLKLGTVVAQDIGKIIALVAILVGALLASTGSKWLPQLLSK